MISELERLYAKNPDSIKTVDPKGWTPLHHAAMRNQPESVVFLVNRGAGEGKKGQPHGER